jgi:hypothetical protein
MYHSYVLNYSKRSYTIEFITCFRNRYADSAHDLALAERFEREFEPYEASFLVYTREFHLRNDESGFV